MDLINKIKKLKQEKNAVILSHCYQNVEIDEVADFVGDSLYLSRCAAKTNADIIVFAGVYFMAQSAKLLSPNKKVLLPNMKSGCLMADMIDEKSLKEFKEKYPNVPVVCYINSTAEVKALSDICCTSSNAIEIVSSMKCDRILFVPDRYLGTYIKSKLPNMEIITYSGFCPTHLRIRTQDIEQMRKLYPNAIILAHPECHQEVLKLVDFIGSTKEIMEYAKKSSKKQFVIATEKGVIDRLKRDYPEKEFIQVSDRIICPNMKRNTLENVYDVLLNETNEITIDTKIANPARLAIEKMLLVPSSN